MDRAGKKVRDIAYHSAKNGGMVTVHSEAARAYSKYLEERSEITAYEACKPLDINRLDALQKTDIRGEYFREQWSSDFYIRHADGTAAVRELDTILEDLQANLENNYKDAAQTARNRLQERAEALFASGKLSEKEYRRYMTKYNEYTAKMTGYGHTKR